MNRRLPTRVTLRNYKSIAACDVSPAPLSFLVGPNGSGKSNFLDALRFVADALRSSLGDALSERGGIGGVLHRLDRRGGGTWNFLDVPKTIQVRRGSILNENGFVHSALDEI